jgi:hypothetical protein
VTSHTTKEFRRLFRQLSMEVQAAAHKSYRLWSANPQHPGLQFKRVHAKLPIWSARVSQGWRVVGVKRGETMVWFWIGSHNDYDNLLNQL